MAASPFVLAVLLAAFVAAVVALDRLLWARSTRFRTRAHAALLVATCGAFGFLPGHDMIVAILQGQLQWIVRLGHSEMYFAKSDPVEFWANLGLLSAFVAVIASGAVFGVRRALFWRNVAP